MNAELEKWIERNEFDAYGSDPWGGPSGFQTEAVPVSDLRALFDGKVLVPADALNAVIELAGVALVYQPFGTKDRQHFDTLLAASQEQGK